MSFCFKSSLSKVTTSSYLQPHLSAKASLYIEKSLYHICGAKIKCCITDIVVDTGKFKATVFF